jgi:hypothetical protein
VEDATSKEGVSCSAPGSSSDKYPPIGGSLSFFTSSDNPDEFWFVVGELGPQVSGLEFRPSQGEAVTIPIEPAPPETGIERSYYAATLPQFDSAQLVALDSDGKELESHDICGPGCEQDRRSEADAAVAEYEAQPVTLESKAAAFASIAVGKAGLIDAFGTRYSYQSVNSDVDGFPRDVDGFAVRFDVSECEPPHGEDGTYRCGGDDEGATVLVGIDDEQLDVWGVDGPMSEAQRERLLSYTHSADDFGPEWRQIAGNVVREQDRPNWAVSYSLVWMGNLPPPVDDYGSMCTMTVYDGDGDVVGESRPLPFDVRPEEESRVSEPVTGLEPDVKDPQDVVVECDDPRANFTSEH